MFFSVIIPTYNPKSFLPNLLTDISKNDCINDMEIIISDDRSTEPFEDILKDFTNLNIRVITNDKHYGFPRNGRQNGANVAKGKWICFSDQDDGFIEHAFDKIKEKIETNNLSNYVITNFIMLQEDGKEVLESGQKGWTHGKFYEKTFWDTYKICYDDVDYCEDINLSTKVSCVLNANNINYTLLEEPIYIWKRHSDSLSDKEYFVSSFPDYIQATLGVIIEFVEQYKNDPTKSKDYQVMFLETLLHMYFYTQSAFFIGKKKTVLEAMLILQPLFDRFKSIFNYDRNLIINVMNNELIEVYARTRNDDFHQIPFVEQMTFAQWLNAYFD